MTPGTSCTSGRVLRRIGPVLNVQGWDLDRCCKVYSEQRAQFLARQEGVS